MKYWLLHWPSAQPRRIVWNFAPMRERRPPWPSVTVRARIRVTPPDAKSRRRPPLFSQHFPSAPNWAVGLGLSLWLAVTAANVWVGVSRAGYSVADELPILLLLFAVPAAAAVLVRWRFL